ncbi:N-acetyltransferase GCN5 [Candidatus Magnetomorum sp. HK-1]|nr:N-acetyltransferase GCN5 [Candidatus Magnetomorum sp. HK-1]
MKQPMIVIRAANPSLDEGLACGRYLNEAGEGFFRFMLGRQFAQIIAKAYPQPKHSYSFQNVSFAEYDNRIVGMTLGFTSELYRSFSDQPLKQAAGYQNLRITAVKKLCAPMMRIIENISDNDFYILAMAIDKDFQGKGIGSALMDSIKEQARRNGSTRLCLDVSANNISACKIYEHWEMKVESQWPKRLPIQYLKFYRMVKEL